MKKQFFDFEVYPTWWLCVVGVYPEDEALDESLKDDFSVFTSDDETAPRRLHEMISNREFVSMGYNIKNYDNVILNAVFNGFEPRDLKKISDLILDRDLAFRDPAYAPFLDVSKQRFKNFVYQDLYDDGDDKSLKDKEASLSLDIRETTVPFNKENLTSGDKEEIIYYCKHDVWSTMKFYKEVSKPYVETKLIVGRVFGISEAVCYKSTNATLSGIALGAEKRFFPDAERVDVEIPDGLKQYIEYYLPKSIVDRVCHSKELYEVELFGNVVTYANGGIHSEPIDPKPKKKKDEGCKNFIVRANELWALVNLDASSFYPATMIEWKTLSRAVKHPEVFEKIYRERLHLKDVIQKFEEKYGKATDLAPSEEREAYEVATLRAAAYKLILNTTYGASGNKFLALSDPYMTTKTCRLGQLMLTALANNLYNSIGKDNIFIVQTNTDGILCYVKREYLYLLYAIGEAFTKTTRILLEYEEEDTIWQKDGNDYIMLKKNGKAKKKGNMFVTDVHMKGYNKLRPLSMYVCKNAMVKWLLEGKPVEESIRNETNLENFVISCNKGNGVSICREFASGPDEPLDRCNRVYASKNERLGEMKIWRNIRGKLSKYKSPNCPPHCELINNKLADYSFDTIKPDIDYDWYIEQTYNLIDEGWKICRDGVLVDFDVLREKVS